MTDIDLAGMLERVTNLESSVSKLLSMVDPQLASRVSSLETGMQAVFTSHLPDIRSNLVSLKASVDALAPGLSESAEETAGNLASGLLAKIEERFSALEKWAANLGQSSHNKFQPPAKPPAEPPAEKEPG